MHEEATFVDVQDVSYLTPEGSYDGSQDSAVVCLTACDFTSFFAHSDSPNT